MVYFPLQILQSADSETDRVLAGTPLRIRFGRGKKEGVPPGAGIAIALARDEFLFAGFGFSVHFLSNPGDPPNVDFLSVDEGLYSDGVWTPGRRLNGDEYGVSLGDLPCMRRVKLYRHP